MKKLLEMFVKTVLVILVFVTLVSCAALGKFAEGYLLGTGFELREQAK